MGKQTFNFVFFDHLPGLSQNLEKNNKWNRRRPFYNEPVFYSIESGHWLFISRPGLKKLKFEIYPQGPKIL